ncbi:MAG: biopolymer transporter ExbD [Bacteriovoracaceae bacterium]|nr:biopolymer transporter ExbD [Bacteriovoracaceae bacterium]
MKAKKKKGIAKINLIPILDAVFIFIFFLLMSAQFVEIYEIGSDAPQIATIKNDSRKDPLNLALNITNEKIIVTTGVNEKAHSTIVRIAGGHNVQKLKTVLNKIKNKNTTESSIIFRPTKSVHYKEIVKIMDAVRLKDERAPTTAGKENQLFDQIIFETIR